MMWLRRREYQALLEKIGDLKSEAARWQGAYETQVAQLGRLEADLDHAKREAAQAHPAAEVDPWAVDPAELTRLRAKMLEDPEATLLSEETGVRT